jgi:hypothetical protein
MKQKKIKKTKNKNKNGSKKPDEKNKITNMQISTTYKIIFKDIFNSN